MKQITSQANLWDPAAGEITEATAMTEVVS